MDAKLSRLLAKVEEAAEWLSEVAADADPVIAFEDLQVAMSNFACDLRACAASVAVGYVNSQLVVDGVVGGYPDAENMHESICEALGVDPDEPAESCEECARSFGPHYTGACEHGGAV